MTSIMSENMTEEKEVKDLKEEASGLWRSSLKKHLSSTFSPTIGQYMSGDQLSSHLEKQLTIHREKYAEPEDDHTASDGKSKSERKRAKFKKKKHVARRGSLVASSSELDRTVISEEGEDEKDIEKEMLRDKCRSRMLDDLELLRDYYKTIYKRALNEKVTSQRKELKEQQLKANERERRLRENEEKAKHKVVIRLPKSEVLNDQSYKQKIPETGYHKIIKLEQRLKKEGYLSKVAEIKTFWDFIMAPGNLQGVLEKGQLRWSDVLEHEKTNTGTHASNPYTSSRTWAVTNIDEMIASTKAPYWRSTTHARSNFRKSSALTDISSSESGRQATSASSLNKQKTAKTSSTTAQTMEQKFPKVEFPPLAAFSLVFGKQEPDPEEVEKEMELQRRLESRRETRRKLITMFSHALANRAATQRLIDKNEEYSFEKLVDASSVHELMVHDRDSRRVKTPLTVEALEAHDEWQRKIEQLESEETDTERRGSAFKKNTRSSSTLSQNLGSDDESTVWRTQERLPRIPAPLTMEVVAQTFHVKEAKGLSTLWVNPF